MVLINHQLVAAITGKRLVELVYKRTRERVVEPHDYGIQHGIARLFAFQTRGYSHSGKTPGWRWFDVDDITRLRVLDETFPGSRADASQHHAAWDQLFARVSDSLD